jgi:hypothetical protein
MACILITKSNGGIGAAETVPMAASLELRQTGTAF